MIDDVLSDKGYKMVRHWLNCALPAALVSCGFYGASPAFSQESVVVASPEIVTEVVEFALVDAAESPVVIQEEKIKEIKKELAKKAEKAEAKTKGEAVSTVQEITVTTTPSGDILIKTPEGEITPQAQGFRIVGPVYVLSDRTESEAGPFSVTLTKIGDTDARLNITQGEQKWEISEKDLATLPPEVQAQVRGKIGRIVGIQAGGFAVPGVTVNALPHAGIVGQLPPGAVMRNFNTTAPTIAIPPGASPEEVQKLTEEFHKKMRAHHEVLMKATQAQEAAARARVEKMLADRAHAERAIAERVHPERILVEQRAREVVAGRPAIAVESLAELKAQQTSLKDEVKAMRESVQELVKLQTQLVQELQKANAAKD